MISKRYRLLAAAPADTSWLDELRRAAYAALFEATWGEWDEARHLRHFQHCLAQGNISVIETAEGRVGMVQVIEGPASVEICELQVFPQWQKGGIGSRVLQDTVRSAHQEGKAVHLSLGLKNEAAHRLYQRMGFQEWSRSETHIHMVFPPTDP